tara:strand:- start:426 stop:782 length:357 start_codon:yes stop_codon:yes gene_type:complete
MLSKFLLENKHRKFIVKKALKSLNNKLNKNINFSKMQKLIKIRDSIIKNNNQSLNNLLDHQKTLNTWWKNRFKKGETSVMGRKYLKQSRKDGVALIKKRTIEYNKIKKTLDNLIKSLP